MSIALNHCGVRLLGDLYNNGVVTMLGLEE